jgi:magnesium transporter
LIAGIYGMNIALPFEKSPNAFMIIFAIMLGISLVLFMFFKKKGWFE